VVAVLGKLVGSVASVRRAGVSWREALSIGVLLNTRGLIELVILNVGLDLGVISPLLSAPKTPSNSTLNLRVDQNDLPRRVIHTLRCLTRSSPPGTHESRRYRG
jgi:hypothetical protein